MKWVIEGEANTKYFHSIVKERKRKQVIHKIKNEEVYQKLFIVEKIEMDVNMFEWI